MSLRPSTSSASTADRLLGAQSLHVPEHYLRPSRGAKRDPRIGRTVGGMMELRRKVKLVRVALGGATLQDERTTGSQHEVTRRADKARALAESLSVRGVRAIALSQVDNAGVTRVKTIPLSLLERAVRYGIGMSPVFEVFLVDDAITSSEEVGGPVGDLRLMPDPWALKVLAAQPGWAWAPVDKHTQEGEVYPGCQRTFAKRQAARAADAGIELRMAFELEWFQAGAASEVEHPIH